MVIIENDDLKVSLHPKGAEIHRIDNKNDGLNYMWKRDPRQWANSAPILFPIVGALNNNECRINGKTYSMTQHGFSRHTEYQIVDQTDSSVTFELKSNEEIAKQYPYLFDLKVKYEVIGSKLVCHMNVKNIDKEEIYFQIGGHPAFACPFNEGEDINSYYMEFEKKENAICKYIDVEKKGMSTKETKFFENENRFFIRQTLFANDAIVLKDLISSYVDLKSVENNKCLRFHFKNFNHLGIWAAKHVGDLIAIEPWVGHIDYVGFEGEFKDKEGVVKLQPNEEFDCEFAVELI